MGVPAPSSHFYTSMGLRLHYLLWGDGANPPVVMVHGGRDHAHMWDAIALALADRYAVYVPDLRGHGDSEWASASQYAIPDFVADLTALADIVLDRHAGERPNLVGHSRGGGIVLRFAGAFPERVAKVVAVDGIGRHTRWHEPAPERLRSWVLRRQEIDSWGPRVYPSLEAAARRVRETNPRVGQALALDLARYGTRVTDGGGYVWKFDPRVRYHPSYDFGDDELKRFFAAIDAPVLLVRGDQSHLGERLQDEWVAAFPNARSLLIAGAGHWIQHDQPEQLTEILRDFLSGRADGALASRESGM